MIETVLAVDIGTTSLKAGLISENGEVVSFYKTSFSAPQNRFIAEAWFWALKSAVSKLTTSADETVSIVAVSISGNGPTLVSDRGLTLCWNEDIAGITALSDNLAGTKSLFIPRINAFKYLFPTEYKNTTYLYSGPEYLISRLTNAACTILPEKRFEGAYWTTDELVKLDFDPTKMPPFLEIGQICGRVTEEAAEFFELPAGIPVFSGGPDFVAALIGTNTLSDGQLCDRSGSSEGFNFCSSKPIYDSRVRTLPSVIPDLWNISVLIPKSSSLDEEERLSAVENAVATLKQVLSENGLELPKVITVTGGQIKDGKYMQKKSQRLGIKLVTKQCSDSELIGDACAAWYGLGKYSSLIEAAGKIS